MMIHHGFCLKEFRGLAYSGISPATNGALQIIVKRDSDHFSTFKSREGYEKIILSQRINRESTI